MTLTRDLTDLLIVKMSQSISQGISIVDARQRADIDLPCLAIVVTGSEPHSVAFPQVQRCTIEMTIRCHAGDADTDIPNTWGGQIEEVIQNPETMKAISNAEISIIHWAYNGSTDNWDESAYEVTFEASCLIQAI
jgi:hypothetical protein